MINVPRIRLDTPSLKDRRFKLIVFEYAIHSASKAQQKKTATIYTGKLIVIMSSQLNSTSSSTMNPNNARTGLDLEGFMIKRIPPYKRIKQIIRGVICLKYARLK